MDSLFINLLNMSITASWLVFAIIVLRFLLKKAPKWINTVLWAFVGFRLVCPFSFESIFSIIPSTDTIPQNITNGPSFDIHTGINIVDSQVNDYLGSHYFEGVTVPVDTSFTAINIFTVLWILGIIAMVLYAGISYFRLHKKVREGVVLKDNIWLCDRIDTPFILGIFKPRIFLPSGISESDIEYVIAHENAHLRRRDHWWKPLGFLLLTFYWFNPVMWLAYILLCRDIELACDEKVIKEMGTDIKKSYSEALINCSISRRTVSACPLAFGETGIKDRIKSVLSYKKPTLWVIVIALISCSIVAVCFLTNPKSDLAKSNPELDYAVSQAIFSLNSSGEHYNSECFAEGHIIYGIEEEGDNIDVYLLEQFSGFGFKNGYFMEQTGHIIPAVFTFAKTDNGYMLTDCDYAENGTMYENSIKRFFPAKYQARVLDPTEKDYADMWAQCTRYAEEYLEKIGRKAEVLDYSEVPHKMLTDVGITVEVSNKIVTNLSLYKYDSDIGNYETLEDGIRYIHRTDFDKERNVVIFTTEVYATGAIIEKIEVDGKTGEIIFHENYEVVLPEPEKDNQSSKDNNLDKLDYTVAAETIKEMPDKYSIQAVHYPKSGESEAAILVGEAYCNEAAYFLNHVSWKRCLPPIESLSSPGSVEFVIDEDYRVTVYERKKGSVFAYAVVKYGDEERYYHASYNDYKNAVAILNPPENIGKTPVVWTYSPFLSATWHSAFAIEFGFNFDYTHTVTSCRNGKMWNLDADGQPYNTYMRFEKDETIYWSPDETDTGKVHDTAELNFIVYNGEEKLYYGNILFDCIEKKSGSATYYIYLQNSIGLTLIQSDTGAYLVKSENTVDDTINYSDLPELVVTHKDTGLYAWTGTATWTYDTGNGTAQSINADSEHALDRKDDINKHHKINISSADKSFSIIQLNFGIMPDEIKVNAWFFDDKGTMKAFDAEVEGLNIIHKPMEEEICLYEVVAEWNSSAKFNGKIHYAFCVE